MPAISEPARWFRKLENAMLSDCTYLKVLVRSGGELRRKKGA